MPKEAGRAVAHDVVQTIDIRGQICPYTLIETREALKALPADGVLEVLCDYEPAATTTIPNFCQKKQYRLETVREGPNLWRLSIHKVE